MDIWQRILAARGPKTARKVSIISGLGMLPFYILFPLVGMAVRIVLEGEIPPRDVAYLFLERHSNEFILGFAVVGLLSALMSSGDSFLNIISISAVRDFVGWGKEKKGMDAKKTQKQVRIAAIIFGFVALFMALSFPKIVDLMVVGLATIVIFVPVTMLALIKEEVHHYRTPALWSIGIGFVFNLSFFIWGVVAPEQFEPKSSFIPGFLTALVTLLIGIWVVNRKNLNLGKL
jgi:Na+/proline symporter